MGKCVRTPEFVLMSHGAIGVKALETSVTVAFLVW